MPWFRFTGDLKVTLPFRNGACELTFANLGTEPSWAWVARRVDKSSSEIILHRAPNIAALVGVVIWRAHPALQLGLMFSAVIVVVAGLIHAASATALNALWGGSAGLSKELGRLFTAHVSSIHAALAPSFIEQNERFGGAKTRRRFFIDENEIFEHMGLGPRSAEQMKSTQPVFSFLPNHLRHFDEIGDLIINRDSGLGGEVSRHVLFQGVSDLNAFFETFSYWKSLFEVSGMIAAAKERGGSLFYGHDFKFDISYPAVPAQSPEENYLFEIYLGNRKCVPRINTIEHVFRLREDPGLRGLKEKLAEWNSLSKDGMIDVARFIREGMDAAARDARTAKGVGVFGKILSAAAFPFRLFMPSAGTVAGAPGKMLSWVSSRQLSSVKWMNFGSDV